MTTASILLPRPPRLDTPPEAFGQAGVRQYIGRVIAWVCLTMGLCSLAMGHRSMTFSDEVVWGGKNEQARLVSIDGRLLVSHDTYLRRSPTQQGWKYVGGLSRWWSRHGPSIRAGWLGAGVEVEGHPLDSGADAGSWVRVTWPMIAAVFMIQPTVYVLRRVVRRYRNA